MSAETWSPESNSPWLNPKFAPTAADRMLFGSYKLEEPILLGKPADVPDDHVAYNPSGIWTVERPGKSPIDIFYVRVEPNRSSATTSHLGKSVVRPYVIDISNPERMIEPYDGAQEIIGEDAALTKVKRRRADGSLEDVWLLSCVDAQPDPIKQNEVKTLSTRFYAGTDLNKLEHIADGPEWMKDIRVIPTEGPLGTETEVFGRPQLLTVSDNGNITHVTLPSFEALSAASIENASIIDKSLLPVGSGVWGGVNDIIRVDADKVILASHRAWRTGLEGRSRHYEPLLYGYDTRTRRIVDLGVLATAGSFPGGVVKDDKETDLSDVVFTGGGYNGTLDFVTFGVGDGNIGLARVRRR